MEEGSAFTLAKFVILGIAFQGSGQTYATVGYVVMKQTHYKHR
jgi:hypothetical protein